MRPSPEAGRPARLPARDECGKGIIAFIIALVVVAYVGNAMLQFYKVKSRHDRLKDFAYETMGSAERLKWTPEQVRAAIVKRAREVGVDVDSAVEVSVEESRWRVRFEWDDKVAFPGFSRDVHYEVDETFKRF